jgi:anti-anti-sigma factor
MDLAQFEHDGNGRLRIGGEIDIATAPGLEAALAECCKGHTITVDCAALTFMASSGIAALLEPVRAGQSVRLVNVPDNVVKVLTVTRLAETFGLDDRDREGASAPH